MYTDKNYNYFVISNIHLIKLINPVICFKPCHSLNFIPHIFKSKVLLLHFGKIKMINSSTCTCLLCTDFVKCVAFKKVRELPL